jgi:DNA repair ATPase RecN
MLQSIALAWISRNVDALVAFITKLDARLDVFLAKHDAEVVGYEQDIEDVMHSAYELAAKIEREAEEVANDLRTKIDASIKSAATVKAIKAALPTG